MNEIDYITYLVVTETMEIWADNLSDEERLELGF